MQAHSPRVHNGIKYIHKFSLGSFKMYWNVDQKAQTIEMALVAPTSGWIAVGLGPTSVHVNLDTIVGYVDTANAVKVGDYWLYDKVAPTLDTTDGGRDNILSKNGQLVGGTTTIKFVRQLNTGDTKDKILESGKTIQVYYAYSTSKDPRTKHTFFGKTNILFFTQGQNATAAGGAAGGTGNVGGAGGIGTESDNLASVQGIFPFHYVVFPVLCVLMIACTFVARFVTTSTIFFYIAHIRLLPPISNKHVRRIFGETLDMTLGEAILVLAHTLCIALYFAMGCYNAPQTTFVPKVARGFGVMVREN